MRRTKIICTVGPSTDDVQTLCRLLQNGMDGARFNFSHGDHASHLDQLQRLEEACAMTGRAVAKILDTKGPEIRIGTFEQGPIMLKNGQKFTLCTAQVPGNIERVSVSYPNLPRVLSAGDSVLINDGLIGLKVERCSESEVVCRVENGGRLSNNKSINLPGIAIHLPALTEKDRQDLAFAAEHDFDYVAASFIRSAEDVLEIRRTLDELGGKDIRIISKIENQQGVDHLDEIVQVSDGVMVARGDLGVEISAARVPVLQKKIIQTCRHRGRTVVVATQMLESMIHNPRPTRAEVSDVANAVFDKASCVMLSGETASGEFPVEALKMMVHIIQETEDAIDYWAGFSADPPLVPERPISDAITHSCCVTARDLNAKAIVTATNSGYTARMVSRFRPGCAILALTTSEKVLRQLSLAWGVTPRWIENVDSTDAIISRCTEEAQILPGIQHGDRAVIVAGIPVGRTGSTNLIKAQILD